MRCGPFILIGLLFLTWVHAEAFDQYRKVDQYDPYFKKYTKAYFGPEFDWRYFKAQAIAESRLEPGAESKDGAVGVMQLLPETFRQIRKEAPEIRGKITEPRWNIAAGIYYDKMLWDLWEKERPFLQRLNFMFASYNAGKSSILEAQDLAIKRGLNPLLWKSVAKTLDDVNGHAAAETISYVREIHKIMNELDQ